MSRNHDALTSIPVNSTMQDLDEMDDFSLLDTENDRRYANYENYAEEYNTESECDFDDYNDDDEEEEDQFDDKHYSNETEHFLKTFSETKSNISKKINRTEDMREMTNITRINNSHKRTLKSFQEKYPMSVQIPNMLHYSSSSLNSYSDDCVNQFPSNANRLSAYQTNSNRKCLSKQDLSRIYTELNTIHNKLVDEYQILQEREDDLKKREIKLKHDEERLLKLAHLDAKLRFEEIKLKYDNEINNIRNDLKEKFKENKRLNEAFRTIKQSNDSLKQQLSEKNDKCQKQEKQLGSLNNRLINLQKKLDFNSTNRSAVSAQQQQQQQHKQFINTKTLTKTSNQSAQQQTLVHNGSILEAFAMLLDWLSQVHLKQTINFNLPFSGDSNVVEKSCRLLPLLAELVITLNNSSMGASMVQSFKKYHLAFLEFIYWAILHCDSSFQTHKVNLTSTFRRIGEELYRSYDRKYEYNNDSSSQQLATLRLDDDSCKESELSDSKSCLFSLFLQSDNSNVRLLSCLIILRTLTQADYIHNVFEILRNDLKNDKMKQLFLDYLGTWTVMKWCKLSNKYLLGYSIDTYLQLSVDWEHVNKFLDACGNESWFSHISLLFKSNQTNNGNYQLDIKILEKLSVLLQKLSKNKSNRKYFEMFSLNKICNDLLQKYYYESSFLIMNLKSILFNLNIQSTNST